MTCGLCGHQDPDPPVVWRNRLRWLDPLWTPPEKFKKAEAVPICRWCGNQLPPDS